MLVSLVFIIYLLFFDKNRIVSQYTVQQTLNEYETKRDFYKSEIKNIKKERKDFYTDKDTQEKIAREKYLMKKENEDIYIFN